MDEYELDNGQTVRVNDEFTMNYDNQQQGVPKGTVITVESIKAHPDGVHFNFSCDFPEGKEPISEEYHGDPIIIYDHAMTELLTDGGLK